MKHWSLALSISIVALPNLVNGQPGTLSSVNNTIKKSDHNNSGKKADGFQHLVDKVLKTGREMPLKEPLAQIIGLPGDSSTKAQGVRLPNSGTGIETRACYIVYESAAKSPDLRKSDKPVCAYYERRSRSGNDQVTQYYRVSLDGRLEKAIKIQGKVDEKGHGINGSGVTKDEDINSDEIKNSFNSESAYWLKDWLKKAEKPVTKKDSASAATPDAKAAAL